MYATWTLFLKEIRRFWKVGVQTVAAPVMTAFLYLLIFGHALSGRAPSPAGVEYTAFLVPGLIIMSMPGLSVLLTMSMFAVVFRAALSPFARML